MRNPLILSAALVLAVMPIAPPARAAEPWGIDNERAAIVKGKVVDLLCEIAGRCSPDCGGGRHQLGIVDASGRLYPAAKGNTLFAGPVADLAPYCGQEVEIDGLVIESPRMHLLFVQKLRRPGETEFKAADAFETTWTARNGKAEEWYRADPLVKSVIEDRGVFGIKGLEPTP